MLTNRKKRITLADIAASANVSKMTVAYALSAAGSKTTRVSEETADKVRKVAEELGYRPNVAARQLRIGKSKMIGVLIDSHAPVVTGDKVAGIEKYCMQRGYRLMFGQAHNDLSVFRQYIDDFASRGVDGLICASHDYKQADVIPNLLKDIPNVLFLRRPNINIPCSSVDVDIADGVSQAVRHLVSAGRQVIGMIQFNSFSSGTRMRFDGYMNAVKELGLKFSPEQMEVMEVKDTDEITTDDISQMVSRLVHQQHVHGIICANDIIAAHAVQACKRMGLRVPQDLSIIGFDNSDFSKVLDPPLTTIDQNVDEVARQAVAVLFDMINRKPSDPKDKKQILVKPKLIIRESA